MGDTGQVSVGWESVVRAVPGGVGVQEEEALAYVSPTFAGIVGRSREKLRDSPWESLFEPGASERMRAALDAARTGGRWRGEVSMVGAGRVPVELSLSSPAGTDAVVWWLSGRDPEAADEHDAETLPRGTSARLARTVLNTIDDVVYVIAEDSSFWFWNERLAETTGYSHEEIAAMDPMEFIPEDQHEYVPGLREAIESIEDRRVEVDILTADGERVPHEFSGTTFEDPETGRSFRCGVARDISERRERERTLRRQRDELATLNRINALLFETAREAIRTGSWEAVTRVLCEQVVASEFYRFAWVGRFDRGTDRLARVAADGVDGGLETIRTDGPADGEDRDVVRRAVHTGELAVTRRRDGAAWRWDETAVDGGIGSVAAVPLDHDGTVYGCLVLGTERPDAFEPRERTGLEVLGRLVGIVLHAARTQKLLFADSVVELEFEAARGESPLLSVGSELDCTLSLDGYVPGGEGWVLYLSTERLAPTEVANAVGQNPRVETVRAITGGDRSARFEVGVSASSLLDVVTDAGAAVRTATVTPTETRFVVEAPIDADIRRIVDRVVAAFPEADPLATRERNREPVTVGRPGGVLDELTARQREVLEAAYRAGYFAWPRESTAEEVADALGIAPSTVHAHLRKSEANILSELLDTAA
ncbi:PAS domain S-box protein [Halosimplex litoreum]|uniref:PAS domain S-box protein n=1 Tax=Halosimplex litoreum TaxID=1198301 RepID=A0A7T3KTZ1_9EURY|nr:bacterio-opsin activator domain-containing protein [Halosimplex litoreum]QPV61509.1 PAS domain S-box protein [Halosimplex litoreum]